MVEKRLVWIADGAAVDERGEEPGGQPNRLAMTMEWKRLRA